MKTQINVGQAARLSHSSHPPLERKTGFKKMAAGATPFLLWLALLSTLNSQLSTINLSWSPSTPGFVLQENLSLTTTNWVNSPSGATNPISVPAALPAKFYRLHKP
jgi:hypothetical protein